MIDVHTHLRNDAVWKEYQKNSNGQIKKTICLPWYDKNRKNWPDLEETLKWAENKPAIHVAGTINMEKPLKPQLKKHETLFRQKKIIAIKLYPGYQHFFPSDPCVSEVAKLCEKYNKPLIFHTGDVYDLNGRALLKYSHPLGIDALAVRYPKTKIIIAHFGFPYILETAAIVSRHKNVFTEISGTIDHCGSEQDIKKLKEQYVADLKRAISYYPAIKQKIMFGTDYSGKGTLLDQITGYIQVVKSVFSKKEQVHVFEKSAEKIFFKNQNLLKSEY